MENPFLFEDGARRYPAVRPKDAASLAVVRRKRGVVRVLMGERGRGHAFLPGHFVFPGGKLEAADQRLAVATDLRPEIRAKVAQGTTLARARGLALAAVRETFEETGLLVGKSASIIPRTRSAAWRRFFGHGVKPHLESLDFIARAITPPGRPRRFDARFFMADAEEIAHTHPVSQAGGELLNAVWLTLAEARAAKIIPITHCIIDEIEARLADGADANRPVPFYIPHRGRAIVRRL
jgi:8-oxo-dGTP pyrophosphatase MutT (NUDIX family)